MHCSRRRLLRRELKFHECTINKSAYTKKSGNLFNNTRIYIYIYIYIIYIRRMIIAVRNEQVKNPEQGSLILRSYE